MRNQDGAPRKPQLWDGPSHRRLALLASETSLHGWPAWGARWRDSPRPAGSPVAGGACAGCRCRSEGLAPACCARQDSSRCHSPHTGTAGTCPGWRWPSPRWASSAFPKFHKQGSLSNRCLSPPSSGARSPTSRSPRAALPPQDPGRVLLPLPFWGLQVSVGLWARPSSPGLHLHMTSP